MQTPLPAIVTISHKSTSFDSVAYNLLKIKQFSLIEWTFSRRNQYSAILLTRELNACCGQGVTISPINKFDGKTYQLFHPMCSPRVGPARRACEPMRLQRSSARVGTRRAGYFASLATTIRPKPSPTIRLVDSTTDFRTHLEATAKS